MYALQVERKNAEPALAGLDQSQSGDARQPVDAVAGERLFVLEDVAAPELLDEINRGAQSDRAGDIGRARLEAVRRILELALLERNIEDHLAPALPRRHRREQLVAAVKHADAGRPIRLVAGKHIKIAVERLHVDVQPRGRLAPVDQHLRAMPVSEARDGFDRDKCPRRIGEVGHRDEPGSRRQQRLERGEIQAACHVDRRHDQSDPNAIAQQLPRHDVRVVLELADQHLIAGLEEGCAPALRNEVDALGRPAHEDDLARVGGVQKRPHLLARLLEQLGRAGAQPVNPAMHIGIIGTVVIRDPVDDRAWFLRAGAGIEEHQIGVARKDRELAFYQLRVEPPP